MRLSKFALVVLLGGLLLAVQTRAANYDPNLPAPAPTLNGGWNSDQVNLANQDSVDSPYLYNLVGPAIFSITDDFIIGDVYKVYDFGNLILTTTFNGPQAPLGGDPTGWLSGDYSHGQVLLAAGNHSLTVQGDGAGGVPAGFYDRIDTAVPLPSAALAGMGLLAALGTARVFRKRA